MGIEQISLESLRDTLIRYRRIIVIAIHLTAIVVSYFLSFLLFLNGSYSNEAWGLIEETLPWLIVIRAVTFIPFRLYEGLWRYTSIWDLRNIILAVGTSSLAFFLLTRLLIHTDYPLSVVLVDSILLIFFLGGLRLARRVYREMGHPEKEKKIVIFGAGDAGEMIVRDMKNNRFYNYEPVGFIDDDPAKTKQSIHGVRVLGSRDDLPRILKSLRPAEILVALPRVGPSKIREIVRLLEPFKIPIKTLPSLRDVLDGKVSVSQIRNLSVEDLLDRAPVGLNSESIRHLIEGKRVLVTGAGGSIGSELCRQIASLEPESLVLLERHENSLYEIGNALLDKGFKKTSLHPVVADIADETPVKIAFERHRPHIIFHAAAHKHVPLMELNPCEAVKNNIAGTRVLATTSAQFEAERFILISSDKAVNPSSVMGATKRVAESIVRDMNHGTKTVFAAVRFGNVLGSNGSVVPRFMEQIKAGGPVTVTHPEMRRYFMLISEAVQLVLHAAAIATAGEIYVLEMGEQIRVVEMARNLIRLTGLVPDLDIPITFIGERPGEKLFEELVDSNETVEPSGIDKILRVKSSQTLFSDSLSEKIESLNRLASQSDRQGVMKGLCELVPTYSPVGINADLI